MQSLSRDPFYIEAFLLGSDTHAHPGLIDRVGQRVTQMASGFLPSGNQWPYVSGSSRGSIIGTGSSSHDQEDDAGAIESVFELCIGLIEWQGQGIGTSAEKARQGLRKYLTQNRRSDVAHTIDKLGHVKNEARLILRQDHVSTEDVDRCLELIALLSEFLGSCNHEWRRMQSEDSGFDVLVCECGAAVQKRGDAWLAV